MSNPTYALTCIGNAIVDVIAPCDDAFLQNYNIEKGSMTLIDEPRVQELYSAMRQSTQTSGGSAANTAAGFGSFGGKGAYLGRVKDDIPGGIYKTDMDACGIAFPSPASQDGPETGRSFIFVTPDGERSMNTFLGAASLFGEDDVVEDVIANSAITYMEGYLFDRDAAKAAYLKASQIAHKAGQQVSLTLSDSFCVARHRGDFAKLIADQVDILFANEDEIMAQMQTDTLEDAINAVRDLCAITAITRSEHGSIIIAGSDTFTVAAQPANKVIDTTGAGDQYAAGFLYGLSQNMDLPQCGKLASIAAAEVISHIGPRPEVKLSTLAA